jgi:lysophospholipase L1-like esterase
LLASAIALGSGEKGLSIVAFGDSTTVGYGVSDSYPQKLARRLFEYGIVAAVFNSGVNGDSTAGGRERFERDVLAHQPDVVIIQFGLNDQAVRLYQKPDAVKSYVTEEEFSTNLQHFAAELGRRGILVVLMTPNPMCWTPVLERNYPDGPYLDKPRGGNLLLRRYVAAEKKLAESEKLPLVDVFAEYDQYEKAGGRTIQELFLHDGVHPNEAGYDLNVKLLWMTLLPLIERDKPVATERDSGSYFVIRDGKPLSAYVVGWGCRQQADYFELARTEHDRNPQDRVSAPVPLGKDWEVQLEVSTRGQSEWSIHFGDAGRLIFSTVSGKIVIDGPLFGDSAKNKFAAGRVIAPGEMAIGLTCQGQRLQLRIDGTDVGETGVTAVDLGPVRVSADSGAIQVRSFRVM